MVNDTEFVVCGVNPEWTVERSEVSQRVSQSDRTGLMEQLFRAEKQKLFAIALRMTGNFHDAEDIVQETFLRYVKRFSHSDPDERAAGWLVRVATNLSIDHLRRRSRLVASPPADVGREEIASASLECGERRQALDRVMSSLSARQRVVFLMKFVEGLTVEQMAERCGCSAQTVRVHLFRATRTLRQALKEREETR